MEVSLPDKNCASNHSLDGSEKCEGSFAEVKCRNVGSKSEIVEAKSLTKSDLPELAVDRIGVEKCQASSWDCDRDLLGGDAEGELQLERGLQVDGLDQRLEALASDAEGIGSGRQVGRFELAYRIGGKNQGLGKVRPGDFDPCIFDDGTGGILNRSGDGLGQGEGRRQQPKQDER